MKNSPTDTDTIPQNTAKDIHTTTISLPRKKKNPNKKQTPLVLCPKLYGQHKNTPYGIKMNYAEN